MKSTFRHVRAGRDPREMGPSVPSSTRLLSEFVSATLDARAQKRTPPCGGYVFWPRPYCTTQRSPEIEIFNRLPGPPRRLDLTQMVLMTTESASSDMSSESGGRQVGAGGSAKTRACIRGIPRSARGRGRVARPDATPTGCRARLSKFQKQSTRKSRKWVQRRIQFWVVPICQNFDSGHAVRTQNIF